MDSRGDLLQYQLTEICRKVCLKRNSNFTTEYLWTNTAKWVALRIWEKWEKRKGKKKNFFFSNVSCQNRNCGTQIWQLHSKHADWHTFFLESCRKLYTDFAAMWRPFGMIDRSAIFCVTMCAGSSPMWQKQRKWVHTKERMPVSYRPWRTWLMHEWYEVSYSMAVLSVEYTHSIPANSVTSFLKPHSLRAFQLLLTSTWVWRSLNVEPNATKSVRRL
jgi:hypothetical protein